MNPARPSQPAGIIKVRYKPYVGVLYIAAAALMTGSGLLALVQNTFSPVWLIVGPFLLVAGILSLFNPFLTFDVTQGNLYMHGPLGNKVRTYGAAKGERLYFDGGEVMRVRQDGSQKRIGTGSGRAEEVQHLKQTLWSLQNRAR
ncbi:hypothetical protein GCM10027447_11590 [Glycomyces halotolerans]